MISLNNYLFEGPYQFADSLQDQSGIYAILDFEKVDALCKDPAEVGYIDYDLVKSLLGLEVSLDPPEYFMYDFHITIEDETNTYTYGKSYDNANVVASTTRNVLIYHELIANNPSGDWIIETHPYYENGQITVRIFQ